MSKLDIQSTQLKRKYSNIRNQLPDIGHRNGVFVFPYELRSGYLNRTERGFIWEDEPDNYNFFQKLITGKDSINVVWQNSTNLFKPKNKNRYEYRFRVGKYYLGEIVGNNLNAETQFYDDDLGRKNIKVNNTITLHFVYNEENDYEKYFPDLRPFIIQKEDMFKLYKIPQLFGEEWMYISNVNYETIPNDNEIVGCFITFTSLNEQLLKSGQTLEGYIHECAPCEPYAKPFLTEIQNEKGEMVPACILDEEALNNDLKSVKYIQVEIFGSNALTSITIIGREIKKEQGKKYFENWKFLLPCTLAQPKIYGLETTTSPSKNFYIFPNCSVQFTKSINWIEQWRRANDVVATNNFSGVLNLGDVGDFSITTPHYSNIFNQNGIHFDYYSETWFPFAQQTFTDILIQSAVYSTNKLKYLSDDNFIDILIKNSFIYLTQLELPLDYSMSKPYKLSNMPVIGGMVSAYVGDRTLISNLRQKKTLPICCIIDCSVATCGSNIFSGSVEGLSGKNIPLPLFGGEEVPKYLGIETCNTSLCFSLTKWLIDSNRKFWDTIYLGQEKDENGNYLLENHQPFLYDGTQKPFEGVELFVVDTVIIQGLINNKIKLTFFGENGPEGNPLWTTTVMSNANFTKSLRNWTTEIKVGGWSEKYVVYEDTDDDFTWPDNPVKEIDYGPIEQQKVKVVNTRNIDMCNAKFSFFNNGYINLREDTAPLGKWDIGTSNNNYYGVNKILKSGNIEIPLTSLPEEWGITNDEIFKEKIKNIIITCQSYFNLKPNISTTGIGDIVKKFNYSLILNKNKDTEYQELINYDAPTSKYEGYIKGYKFVDYQDTIEIFQQIPVDYSSWRQGWAMSAKAYQLDRPEWYRKCWFNFYFAIESSNIRVEEAKIKIPITYNLVFTRLELPKDKEISGNDYFGVAFFYTNTYDIVEGKFFGGTLTTTADIYNISFEIK